MFSHIMVGANDLDASKKFYDAVLAFARATEMVEVARREWVSLGRPWRTINPNGAEGIHPIVKVIRDLESDAYRARRALKLSPDTIKRAGPGRPPGAGSASDRKAPPVVKLSTKKLET